MIDQILTNCYEHCRNLKKNYESWGDSSPYGNSMKGYFDVETGRKYYKIVHVQTTTNDVHTSVHCFVDKKTGDVYKAAGWAAPAKGVRFNILRDMDILRNADWAGSYLYLR